MLAERNEKSNAKMSVEILAGDIGINRGQDMANLALGSGTIGANYHLAQGANGQNLVNALGQKLGGENGSAVNIAGLSKLTALM